MEVVHWFLIVMAVVLLFGAAVFVHEFGHFWVARRLRLKVEGFSIGFGPKLFGWTSKGVVYAWRLIPAGGFVALPQMANSEVLEGATQASELLPPVSPESKILVALAGPVMNGVFAFTLATAIYFLGLPVRINPAIIGGVEPGSAEAKAGIRAGDRIVAVNGKPVRSWEEAQMTTAMAPTNVLLVTIQRDQVRTNYLLQAKTNPELGLKLLNLQPREHPTIEQVVSGGAAQKAGLKPGDVVISFDGVPIVSQEQLVGLIKKRASQPSRMQVKRAHQILPITVVPSRNPTTGTGVLGVLITAEARTIYEVQKPGPLPWRLLGWVCRQTFETIDALVHSRQTGVGVGQLSGPPGILAMLALELRTDYRLALKFMVLLNVSLAVLNLLPLPVLDGGYIAMALLEKVRGRPLNPQLQQYAATVFAMLLIGFMLYVSYNDVVKRLGLFKTMFEQKVQIESGAPGRPAARP